MQKREALRYLLIGVITIVLISILIVLKGGFTGYAIFEDSGIDFNSGTYVNTTYNGSDIILLPNNLTGTYTSQIFDATADANWNNLTSSNLQPNVEYLFAVDGAGDVYKSSDQGQTWILTKEGYGRTSDSVYMFSDINNLYIISNSNREVWKSTNQGQSFLVINDSFADSGLLVADTDSNQNLFVVDASGDVYISTNQGATWTLQGDFNAGATNNAKGIAINSSDAIFIVDGSGEVYESTDLAVTWTKVNNGYGGGSGTDDMTTDGTNLYIVLNKEIFQSTNSGNTWILTNNSFTPYPNDGLRAEKDSNYIYIADETGRVFQSTDYGISWQEKGDLNAGASNNPKGLTNFIQPTNLTIQVRNCSQSNCADGIWQSANLNNINLQSRYFQYKATFITQDSSTTPSLNSVSLDYTILNTPPSISITSPQSGNTYGYNESINLNFTASDSEDNIDACWYNLNSQNNITISNCQNTTFNTFEGSQTLNLYINDTLGEQSSDSTTFNIQVGAPTITLNFPINTYLNYNNLTFNYTPTDIDLSSCELWGDFTGEFIQNQTDNSPTSGQVNSFQLTLPERTYIWNVKCNDSLGNSAFNGNQTFHIDTTNPSIQLTQPIGAKTSRTIPLQFITNDSSSLTCTYNVYRGANIEITNTTVNCSTTSSTFSVTVDADFILNFYITDSAGNANSTSSSFSVDTSTTPPPSGGGGGGSGGGGGGGSIGNTIIETIPEAELEISELGEIIAQPGDKKTLILNAKNTGKKFLNNCKLIASGELSSWIYSDQIEGIAPGENFNFIFNLNVPEGIQKDSSGNLEISCDEITKSQEIKIILPKTSSLINIKQINYEGDSLNLSYTFDNSQIVGDNIGIEIWITDEEETEIKKTIDNFPINFEGPIERNIIIPLEKNLVGIYYIYMAISSDRKNFVKQSIVLGKPTSTGQAILEGTDRGKLISYIVFIIIVIGAIFFGVKGSIKKFKFKKLGKKSPANFKTKNKSLLPKTKKFNLPKLRVLRLFKKKYPL